jgi:hypothetical protein
VLIGYVSDEQYVALAGAWVQFEQDGDLKAVVRSTPSGGVYADIPEGRYLVTLACRGYGSKRSTVDVSASKPYQFRLLSDKLSGYVWPKWARSGDVFTRWNRSA